MRRIAFVLTVATLMAAMVMTTALAASQAGNDNGGGAGPARDHNVTICHKDHVTITLDEHAWPAHRDRHKDTLGACSTEEAQQEASEENRPEIEVFSVSSDGRTTKIRSPGKPPWAGGPKVVGKKHPGFAGCCKDNE